MKLLGIYTGAMLVTVLGVGAFFLYRPISSPEALTLAAVCEARGGSWVHGSQLPLCMTPDEGLLEFVDGSFVMMTDGTNDEQIETDAINDPWKEGFKPPLAGEELARKASVEDEDSGREDERRGGTSSGLISECVEKDTQKYTGTIADVDFSSWPEATKYRTAITEDVERGVNFAGSYVVSTWGCAKSRRSAACVGHAVVNARTGEIVLYDVIAKRTGDFSVGSNLFSVTLQNGEEKVWSVEQDTLVNCL